MIHKNLIRVSRMVKTALIVTVLSLVAGFSLAHAASFADVPENTPNYGAVEYLKSKNVINGYADGTFKPDQTINRAEALKIILLAAGIPTKTDATITFSDVHKTDWFFDFVRTAYYDNIIDGYTDGTFKPANNINLAESLKMILLAFKIDVAKTVSVTPYPDVSKTAWYVTYATTAKNQDLVAPNDQGNLNAGRNITRGEFAQIIYRLMYIREKKLDKFPLNTDWQTFTHPSEHYAVKFPYDWLKIAAGDDTIFWKKDSADGQVSFDRVFPNGASVVISLDANPSRLSLDNYVAKQPYFTKGVTQVLTLNNYPFANITIADRNQNDYYFYLPNNSILILYTETGTGANKPYLEDQIRNIVQSVSYNAQTGTSTVSDKDIFLSTIRQQILVKGGSDSVISQFKDLVVISTDSIGIGTGPIDYEYSTQYDVTLKIERNSKTLLAISSSKNTAF